MTLPAKPGGPLRPPVAPRLWDRGRERRRPVPMPPPRPCRAMELFREWRRARELGHAATAERALEELKALARRPRWRDCWQWLETEEATEG